MNTQIENFWPADIGVNAMVTPVAILREQASLLARQTKGLVEGRVSTSNHGANQISHAFEVVAPALDGYRYELFRVSHGVLLYPVSIESDSTALRNILSLNSMQDLKNEDEFKQWLKGRLASEHTKQVVNSLLAQSTQIS